MLEKEIARVMRQAEGSSLRVDLDGSAPPREKRSTRSGAQAASPEAVLMALIKPKQTASRKTYLQSLTQISDARQSKGWAGSRCSAYQDEDSWFCSYFNNVHPADCKCRKCLRPQGHHKLTPICTRHG